MMEYFIYEEFDSPDEHGSGLKYMKRTTLEMLDKARKIAGIPFKINSGYRTEAHNEKVGGSLTSSHREGCAVDIHCTDSKSRWLIVHSLISVGFVRIGIAKTFIHADNDINKSNSIWLY